MEELLPPSGVIVTPQLVYRACRPANLKEENEAFHELALCLVSEPDRFLDRLVEVALRLCQAGTVGISLESTDAEGKGIFRWIAMAGELKALIGGTTPRDFSPCGICVDQNQPTLMRDLVRAYPYLKDAPLPIIEALLLPWGIKGGPMGTLWVVAHSDDRNFDLHDVRVMGSLAAFAFGAIYLKQKTEEAEKISAAFNMSMTMAHYRNNPLQGALLSLFRLKTEGELNATARDLLAVLEGEIQRVSEASSDALRWAAMPPHREKDSLASEECYPRERF
jgi:GAF domain